MVAPCPPPPSTILQITGRAPVKQVLNDEGWTM
jgi:hypothetical protein